MRRISSFARKTAPALLRKWIVVTFVLCGTGGCSAFPSVMSTGDLFSDRLSQITSWSGKVANNFMRGSSDNNSPYDQTSSEAPRAESLIRAGDSVRAQGDISTAAWYYARAAAVDPSSFDAELQLGAAELALKDREAAVTAYQKALRLAPKDPEAAMRLGEIELARGDPTGALQEFSIALISRKDDPTLYNAMGVAWTMSGNYRLAQQEFNEGLRLRPEYPALINNYGLMQLKSGDLVGALTTFSALTESPHATERYRTNRALVELALGQTAAALADASNMDEVTLRQLLARYHPAQTSAAADIDVHLAIPVDKKSAAQPTSLSRLAQVQDADSSPLP